MDSDLGLRQRLIAEINDARKRGARESVRRERDSDDPLDRPSRRLAVYGSLAPGRSNHHHLADLKGVWTEGWVKGVLHDRGWGAGMGFPGIVLRPGGPRVAVWVMESDDLPAQWSRLDAFEGDEYVRLLVPVHDEQGQVAIANIYTLRIRD